MNSTRLDAEQGPSPLAGPQEREGGRGREVTSCGEGSIGSEWSTGLGLQHPKGRPRAWRWHGTNFYLTLYLST